MRFSLSRLVTLTILFSAPLSVLAAIPSPAHNALTQAIERSVEWSGHIKTEVAKGKKLDPTHLRQEIASLKTWLDEMTKTYADISVKYPYEKDEGHFIAVKKHQTTATESLKNIEAALEMKDPNYRQMKKLAKRLTAELELAAREHRSELNEIEAQ